MQKRKSVIVIGAGVAGLSCASELAGHDFDVVVLEARARIGGRVFSDESLGFPIDLGASWIMGHETNPLTQLARAAGAELLPTDWDSLAAFHQGKRVTDEDLDELADAYAELLEQIAAGRSSLSSDISIETAIAQALSAEQLSAVEQQGCDFAFSMLGLDAAADMDELGVAGQEQDHLFHGADALVKGGYGLVPRYLARGLSVRMNHVVTRIEHGPSGVVVETNQGRFEAASCVVSLPLAVLQDGKVNFSPALPDEKRAAIWRLRMGTLDKVALVLPRRIFPEGADFLGRMGDEPRRFPLFLNLERVCGRPAVVGFVAGKLARALEKKTDAELVDQAMRSLRDMLGTQIPEPTHAAVVRWSADPFAGGSYSYVPLGAQESDRDILSAPVDEQLFFCGEATMRNYSGTVHGAYLSGLRTAARLAGTAPPQLTSDRLERGHRSRLSRRHRTS